MSRRAGSSSSSANGGEESIYNLISQPTTTTTRPSLYRSKYPHDTPPTASTFGASTTATNLTTNLSGDYALKNGTHRHKQLGGTFGPKSLHAASPQEYQKTNERISELPQPERFEYTDRQKPQLETHHAPDSAVVQARSSANTKSSTKNFITENALAVIMSEARKPMKSEQDYLAKEDFGKTPKYLEQVKGEIEKEKEYIRRMIESEKEEESKYQPKTSVLPEEERLKLLASLKLKWESVNKQYQTTTHMITLDTMGKVRRKEKYETELQQIEKSIEKLSKPFVFVQAY